MRIINKIILHCSASKFGDMGAVTKWHREKGFNGCGYHYLILNGFPKNTRHEKPTDGLIQMGRPISVTGAHCKGQNHDSIGICLVGMNHFTDAQFASLGLLIESLMWQYKIPPKNIYAHNDFNHKKTCPNFKVHEWVLDTFDQTGL